jgi:hypothetical protein
MAGRNYGTMFMGYYYDESWTNIGYDIYIEGGIAFHNVAYHSKRQLIVQLTRDGHNKDEIKTRRVKYLK